MRTVSDIIDAFGGPTAMAVAIGTTQQNVTNMRSRGTIPAGFFKAIAAAARKRGIEGLTLALLAEIAANDWNRVKRGRAA